jgi:hypothetical protein
VPYFAITKGTACFHLVPTDRIAIIEMAKDLLDAGGCCSTSKTEP